MGGRRVLLHCDARDEVGMGHLMRTLAIAQMARRRGWAVSAVGEVGAMGIALADRLVPGMPFRSAGGEELARELRTAAADGTAVIHLDTYADVPAPVGGGALVSTMQDGAYGAREADLAIDANLGSERFFHRPERSVHQLAGIDAAVIREQVLGQRGVTRTRGDRPRVLVVLGGTDAAGLTARVVAAFDRVTTPLHLTVVDARGRADVQVAARASPHAVRVIGFADDLPAVASAHDLAVTAAGTTVWDFASIGIPMALLCVADNQRRGYREVVEHGLAAALGEPPHDDLAARVADLSGLLSSPRMLHEERRRLMQVVDGLGTWRIVASWEQLVDRAPQRSVPPAAFDVRDAGAADAQILFDWRNDETTRGNSRTHGPLRWEDHRSWLDRVLADEDRQLLIIEQDESPVATVRWDRRAGTDWEVSLTVAPEQRGRGLAAGVLAAGEEALRVERPHRLLAGIHVDNRASIRLFERAGYLPHLPPSAEGFLTLAKWRLPQNR